MPSFPNYAKRSRQGLVQQIDTLLHQYLQRAKCIICITLYRGHWYKTLRSYIACFNKEALLIDEAVDKIFVAIFTNGLLKGKFLFSLYKNDLKTMSNVLYQATKYMNAENALLAREEKPKKRDRQEDVRQERGRKMNRTRDRWEDRHSKLPTERFINFIPLTTLIDQVLMPIKDNATLSWPSKLKGVLNRRSKDKYFHFHRDHGHDTSKCYDLKQQIETLIRQGKLQRFISKKRTYNNPLQEQPSKRNGKHPRLPLGDIKMIVGGTTASSSIRKA